MKASRSLGRWWETVSTKRQMTGENSRHFATPTIVSPRNERRNSILTTRHYPDLDSASVVEEAPVTPVLCGGIPLTFGGIH